MKKTIIQVIPQNEPMRAVVLGKSKNCSAYCQVIAWCIFVDEENWTVVQKEPIVSIGSEGLSVWYEVVPGGLWADESGDDWMVAVGNICKTYGYVDPDKDE